MAFTARLQISERGAERKRLDVAATLRGVLAAPHDTLIVDVSLTGCRFSDAGNVDPGDRITLGLPGLGVRQATVIRKEPGYAASAFTTPLTQAELDTLLALPDTSPIALPVTAARAPEPVEAGKTDDGKLPVGQRILIIVGASLALWAIIILGVVALWRLVS